MEGILKEFGRHFEENLTNNEEIQKRYRRNIEDIWKKYRRNVEEI